MQSKKLKPVNWDDYLMGCYFKFLRTEGNYIQVGSGKCLKPGIKYRFTDSENRNPEVIPTYIWKHLIIKHFLKYNYN